MTQGRKSKDVLVTQKGREGKGAYMMTEEEVEYGLGEEEGRGRKGMRRDKAKARAEKREEEREEVMPTLLLSERN